jgi:hypothetical protein
MDDRLSRIIDHPINNQGIKGDIPTMKNDKLMIGVITSRKCPTCGHHEVGYETPDGAFVPLRPGDRIAVFPKAPIRVAAGDPGRHSDMNAEVKEKDPAKWAPWVPEALRCNSSLCRRYGVLVDRALLQGQISPALYEMAYKKKLRWLIEKEVATPLSVILDRFFAAPYLASGNAKQAADALWEELDEIRAPATSVTAWLRDKSDASLLKMIHPKTSDELKGDRLSDDQLKEELDRMSLEDFLESL